MHRSLVGIVANLFAVIGIRIERLENSGSKLARTAHILAQLINIADIVIDCLFMVDLAKNGNPAWATLMGTMTVFGFLLASSYDANVMQDALDRYGYSFNFAYYYGTLNAIIFMVEDTTTILLYSMVQGVFDKNSWLDKLNLVSTLASATMVSIFILIGGAKLILRGKSADWIPQLSITRAAKKLAGATTIDLTRIMSIFIFVKCLWIVIVLGFSAFLVFGYILQEKLIDGRLATATRVIHYLSVIMGVLLVFRLPRRKQKHHVEGKEDKRILKCSFEGTTREVV